MLNEISKWLDNVLKQPIPEDVVAFCFNLYEDGYNKWSMELVGTECFHVDDEDWCCNEITDFGTREGLFSWNKAVKWDKILIDIISYLKEYLENGTYAEVLKSKEGVGVGFVDGDVEILYRKKEDK